MSSNDPYQADPSKDPARGDADARIERISRRYGTRGSRLGNALRLLVILLFLAALLSMCGVIDLAPGR